MGRYETIWKIPTPQSVTAVTATAQWLSSCLLSRAEFLNNESIIYLMKAAYYCPHCNQSTRQWNMEVHMKRKHGVIGRPIPKMPNAPSAVISLTGILKYMTNLGLQTIFHRRFTDFILVISQKSAGWSQRSLFKTHLVSWTQYLQWTFGSYRTPLGFKAHICEWDYAYLMM